MTTSLTILPRQEIQADGQFPIYIQYPYVLGVYRPVVVGMYPGLVSNVDAVGSVLAHGCACPDGQGCRIPSGGLQLAEVLQEAVDHVGVRPERLCVVRCESSANGHEEAASVAGVKRKSDGVDSFVYAGFGDDVRPIQGLTLGSNGTLRPLGPFGTLRAGSSIRSIRPHPLREGLEVPEALVIRWAPVAQWVLLDPPDRQVLHSPARSGQGRVGWPTSVSSPCELPAIGT